MSQERPLESLDDVARLLRTLSPAGRIDRDRVMYLAGRQSSATARPGRAGWAWPVATGLASTVAAILAVVLAIGPDAAVMHPHDAGDPATLLAEGYPANELLDVARPSSHLRLRRDLLAGVSPEQSAARLEPKLHDAVRPRDFDFLSRGGHKL